MSDIKDNLYSQILSLNENEVRIFLALMQDKLLEESAAVPDITPPEGMTKADCKRLIKSIRTKQPYADARTQQYSLRVISHIRNVWVPQIKNYDQQADWTPAAPTQEKGTAAQAKRNMPILQQLFSLPAPGLRDPIPSDRQSSARRFYVPPG